jgi:energy-coupling factor transporter ATP-binding protein EcfA2
LRGAFAVIEPDRAPYPGLRSFERNETHLFFGRDDCVDQMIARLAERRFLAVLGSSGTGKSSLVKTGLLSGLEMGLLPGAGSRWLIADFKPGGNPLRNLAYALLTAENTARKKPKPTDNEIAGLEARFKQQGPRELIKWCQEGHLADGTNLLVLVDQFEELFNYQSNDQRGAVGGQVRVPGGDARDDSRECSAAADQIRRSDQDLRREEPQFGCQSAGRIRAARLSVSHLRPPAKRRRAFRRRLD